MKGVSFIFCWNMKIFETNNVAFMVWSIVSIIKKNEQIHRLKNFPNQY
jgi:hypothetical protein